MHGILRSNLKRAFLSVWFPASVIAAAAMCCLCAWDYMDRGANPVYLVDIMLNLGMLKKVLVFFAAVPFVTVYCQDFNSGYIHSLVVRSNARKYAWSDVLVCALSGFSAVFFGILVFFAVLSFFYPVQPYETPDVYGSIAWNSPVLYAGILSFVFALYAAMWTVVGLTLSALLPDKYVALGSPLILGYVFEELTAGLPAFLNLYSLSHNAAVFGQSPLLNFLYTLSIFVLVMAVSGWMFSRVVKRRSQNEMG